MSIRRILRVVFQNVKVDINSRFTHLLQLSFLIGNRLIVRVFNTILFKETDHDKGFYLVPALWISWHVSISLYDEIAASFEGYGLVIEQNKESDISNKSTFLFELYFHVRVWKFSFCWTHYLGCNWPWRDRLRPNSSYETVDTWLQTL